MQYRTSSPVGIGIHRTQPYNRFTAVNRMAALEMRKVLGASAVEYPLLNEM